MTRAPKVFTPELLTALSDRFKALAEKPFVKKKVLVIGGGPAGMKAAEIAARRG